MNLKKSDRGYIMIARALLTNICNEHPKASGNFEAFLRVLTNVNFETATFRYNGETRECKRGESIISFAHWAEIFGWSRGRTRRFFQNCFNEGSIHQVAGDCVSHISIPGYDAWTGNQAAPGKGKRPTDPLFLEFWEEYHEITHTCKKNYARAYVEWKKLSVRERQLATQNIDEFYHHLKKVSFCPQAATYLRDKAFMDEWERG